MPFSFGSMSPVITPACRYSAPDVSGRAWLHVIDAATTSIATTTTTTTGRGWVSVRE
jgi:hypothetical protein